MSKKNITISKILVYKFYSLLGHICRGLFQIISKKKLEPEKEASDDHLLLFCGQKGARMIKPVLISVYNTWNKIPYVTIVTDGTPPSEIESYLKFWPYAHKIKSWEESAAFHLEQDRKSLINWARINVYARKIVAILAEAELRPTLYCDTDVLWFGEARLPTTKADFTMRISQDNVHTYCLPVIRRFNRMDMLEKKPLNAGIIFMSGSPYKNDQYFSELIDFVQVFDAGVSEQTVMALLADKNGDTWSLEDIIVNTKDLHWPIIPGYFFSGAQFARHHVLTKNSWFWRDALYILLFRNINKNKLKQVRS